MTKTPWLGIHSRPQTRPVKDRHPTPEQVARTVLAEMNEPGYMVSFYEGDVITLEQALVILAKAVMNKKD
jgi:hypothetical protein